MFQKIDSDDEPNGKKNLQRILVLLSPVLILNFYPYTIESSASSHYKDGFHGRI